MRKQAKLLTTVYTVKKRTSKFLGLNTLINELEKGASAQRITEPKN